MSQGYQKRDRAIVDYRLWQATPDGDWLRGPRPASLRAGEYFACVGAAQTFGCFCERPWPTQLAERLALPVLNLGVAGAGPALFRSAPYRDLLAGARFVVFQVMSGRSADNSRFESGGRERLRDRVTGAWLGADRAWSGILQADLAGVHGTLRRGLRNRWCAAFGRGNVRSLVAETRADWLAQFSSLLDETRAPKVLFWFSRRTPRYRPRYHSLGALFGEFPQLVDEAMVAALARRADRCIECVTARGSPQLLPVPIRPADAGSGEPADALWTHNRYYPSPEMHDDGAAALLEACRALA